MPDKRANRTCGIQAKHMSRNPTMRPNGVEPPKSGITSQILLFPPLTFPLRRFESTVNSEEYDAGRPTLRQSLFDGLDWLDL
jgi:hypothetical protein